RRMADLTMVASEDKAMSAVEQPKVSANEAPSVNTAVALTAQEKINYKNAIDLYEKVIADAPPNSNLAQDYYLLAKAYDMNGMPDQSLKTLNILVQKYPNAPFQSEAQFRRGELLFNQGDFSGAEQAYADVVKGGEKSGYYEQAKYKQGWCQFKQSDYDHAVVTFTQLLDHFQAKKTTTEAGSKTLEKIRDDTLRVTSMSFSYLDGPGSLASHFQKSGNKPYEVDLYKSLAGLYVTQERYLDAANTYQTFVKTHPFHPEDPAFSTAEIDTYIKGNYPSKILPAKQDFVEQYGIKSEFWKKVTPEQRNAYLPSLKQHIVELAQYHHAKGQQSNAVEEFNLASRWYREFLETFPTDENAPVMNELLAESLFSAKQFQPSIQEFEHTAYDYKNYPDASKAGYFALLGYQEILKAAPATDPARKEWVKKKTQSSFRFVDKFSTDKRCPDILSSVLDDQLAVQDLEGVIQTSDKLAKLNPPASLTLQQRAWQAKADAEFDLKRYKDAESSYGKVLGFAALTGDERRNAQERQAASIYKQAEALRDGGKPQDASKEFLRVGQVQPNASIKPNADYDAAALMLAAKDYPNAIKVLENFRKQYPNHELAAGIPEKLTVAYQQLGSLSNAAGELEKVAKQRSAKDPAFARDAIWQAADMQESS
ncbi:MAG TPA: tetratricopeptide repeat protein, partial [Pseudomonadales bacterium]|nr:tetratricopeptide repeat protein [Pseudomonadales bacterium]